MTATLNSVVSINSTTVIQPYWTASIFFAMHKIDFFYSKSNVLTCTVDSIPLHSKYDPIREAEQFSASVKCDFIPSSILIVEPGIGYSIEFLKKNFPQSKIYILRFTHEFDKFNNTCPTIYCEKDALEVENEIFNLFGEEKLCQTLFLAWRASNSCFPEKNTIAWEGIKKAISKGNSILATRSFFSKRWLYNSFKIIENLDNYLTLRKISKPVVITASGPSLQGMIYQIKASRKKMFLLALSSSLSVLLYNGIIPDAILSTDGGYFASNHLKKLSQTNNIPLIIGIEGYCFSHILKKSNICPLLINDSVAQSVKSKCNFPTVDPNGTVSGTALQVARLLTDSFIFFCGLDLEIGNGFQHSSPNENELQNSLHDNRLRSQENRIVSSMKASISLDIYRNWFSSLPIDMAKNVFRVSDNYPFKNNLKNIKDVGKAFFKSELSKENDKFENPFEKTMLKNKKELLNDLLKIITTDDFCYKLNPLKKVQIEKSLDENRRNMLRNELYEETTQFINKIKERFFH